MGHTCPSGGPTGAYLVRIQVTSPETVLQSARTILVIDWPSRDVPEALARAGWAVIVRGGPGPKDYSAYEWASGDAGVVVRKLGSEPEQVDLVYCHRPLSELPGIVAMARALGGRAVWVQSGFSGPGVRDPTGCWVSDDDSRSARDVVESAGLIYIQDPYIGETARRIRGQLPPSAHG